MASSNLEMIFLTLILRQDLQVSFKLLWIQNGKSMYLCSWIFIAKWKESLVYWKRKIFHWWIKTCKFIHDFPLRPQQYLSLWENWRPWSEFLMRQSGIWERQTCTDFLSWLLLVHNFTLIDCKFRIILIVRTFLCIERHCIGWLCVPVLKTRSKRVLTKLEKNLS